MAITTYRRPKYAVAAVQSCLNQGPHLNRVIVMDDGSNDDTEQRIAAIGDPRILYQRRATNGGISAARHDALAVSTADWTIPLDDDWELMPGAIDAFVRLAKRSPPNTIMLGSRMVFDTGKVSPTVVPTEPIDYVGQLHWRNHPESLRMDNVCAISQYARERENWLPGRFGRYGITLFYLDVARHGLTLYTPEILALERTPTIHSVSRAATKARLRRRKLDAPDGIKAADLLLKRHGREMAEHARSLFSGFLTMGALCHLLMDQRRTAFRWSLRALRMAPANTHAIALALSSVLGRRFFETAYRLRGLMQSSE